VQVLGMPAVAAATGLSRPTVASPPKPEVPNFVRLGGDAYQTGRYFREMKEEWINT